MRASAKTNLVKSPLLHRRQHSGMTMLELLIVVAVIGVLGAIALPSYVRSRQRAQNVQTMGDLKSFAGQLEIFNGEMRMWPDDKGPGRFPDKIGGVTDNQLEQSIKRAKFEALPGIGGQFDWDYNTNGVHAAIAVANPTADNAQLVKLDELMDDGSLTTGALRQVPSGQIYVLQQSATGH
jgi:prepilin-type N-terminal cleavage/methylation domain-containing protein